MKKVKLLVVSSPKNKDKDYYELSDLFRDELGIELSIDTMSVDVESIKAKEEKEDRLSTKDIYDKYAEGYDWVHVRMTYSEWKSRKFDKRLFGSYSGIGDTAITQGRWRRITRVYSNVLREFPGIDPHVLGMIHEYLHHLEGDISIAHSFMYGYDKVYLWKDEINQKPSRDVKKRTLKGALLFTKLLIEGKANKPAPKVDPVVDNNMEYNLVNKYIPKHHNSVELEYTVLHVDLGTAKGTYNHLKNVASASYHDYIPRSGNDIYNFVPHDKGAWHSGKVSNPSVIYPSGSPNRKSYGLCYEGRPVDKNGRPTFNWDNVVDGERASDSQVLRAAHRIIDAGMADKPIFAHQELTSYKPKIVLDFRDRVVAKIKELVEPVPTAIPVLLSTATNDQLLAELKRRL